MSDGIIAFTYMIIFFVLSERYLAQEKHENFPFPVCRDRNHAKDCQNNDSRLTVIFFVFSCLTVSFFDVSRLTVNPIETPNKKTWFVQP